MQAETLRKQIGEVQERIGELGPIHPGSVSEQYQVCGKPGCKCADPENPRRHGPYGKLSYVHRGKAACRFVRADIREEINQRTWNYRELRKLIDEWIELSIQLARIEFFPAKPASKRRTK